MTPAETADMFVAYRRRENLRLLQESYKLALLIAPYAPDGKRDDFSALELFKRMPGSFPEDEDWGKSKDREPELTPAQKAEKARRMAIPRLQRPR